MTTPDLPRSPSSWVVAFTFDNPGSDPTITALDANKNVIESFDMFGFINVDYFDVNNGECFGFTDSSPEIAYFQISGGISMSDMPVSGPELATWVLSGLALAAVGLIMRKRIVLTQCAQIGG